MLDTRLSGYLGYFENLLQQPPNRWDGFYIPTNEAGGFGLRYQLAFACYALAALALHPQASPAERQRCQQAMSASIERMLQRRVWAYRAIQAEQAGIVPDPIAYTNSTYSCHLAMMIGLYEAVGGDARYDEPFRLRWSYDQSFTYTHSTLLESLWQQMRSSPHHGIESTPGAVALTPMQHALWANALHDSLHGSEYAAANAPWQDFVQQQLVRPPGLLGGGSIFIPLYTKRRGLFAPAGLNVVDAWSLAFLQPFAPEMVESLAPRFFKTVCYTASEAEPYAYVPTARKWQKREIADASIANGFGYLLAVQLGEQELAAALLRYADLHFKLLEHGEEHCYSGGLSTVFTTALFTLGEAGSLRHLSRLLAPPAPAAPPAPEHPATDSKHIEHEA
jgi:hypothetical protein